MADYMDISEELREQIKEHYKRPEVIEAMLEASDSKEVVGSFGGVGYAKRPAMLAYENDIYMQVKNGITSFHISEETWRNPLELAPGLEKKKLSTMRVSWDLIIDIDCPHWEICKLITHLLIQEIKNYGVKNVSVKFSGNKGFHIGVPSESFAAPRPYDFPELPQKIAGFLLQQIEPKAAIEIKKILEKEYGDDFLAKAEELFHKPKKTLIDENMELRLQEVVEVDTILITPRHLYRMVYSVNEKSGLVSIPINPDKVMAFEKDVASIQKKANSRFSFLDRSKSEQGEAEALVIHAREYSSQDIQQKEYTRQYDDALQLEQSDAKREFEELTETIPEQYFPDSINVFLAADYNDGKKRAIFVLKNFLASCRWPYDEIEKRLYRWNEGFDEPIRESVLKGQLLNLRTQMKQGRIMMPPNFSNAEYYADIIGLHDDYKRAKNPVSLAIKRFTISQKNEGGAKSSAKNTAPKKTKDSSQEKTKIEKNEHAE